MWYEIWKGWKKDEPAETCITIIEFLSPQIINHTDILLCSSSQDLLYPVLITQHHLTWNYKAAGSKEHHLISLDLLIYTPHHHRHSWSVEKKKTLQCICYRDTVGFSGLNDATMPFLAFHRCGKHCNCRLRIFFYVTVVNNPLYNSNLLLAFTFKQTLYFTSCSIYPCLPKLVTNIFSSCGMITLSLWISCRCGHVCPRPVWDENTAERERTWGWRNRPWNSK